VHTPAKLLEEDVHIKAPLSIQQGDLQKETVAAFSWQQQKLKHQQQQQQQQQQHSLSPEISNSFS
jgi:hypothetical protein